jgi:hypothetical protein
VNTAIGERRWEADSNTPLKREVKNGPPGEGEVRPVGSTWMPEPGYGLKGMTTSDSCFTVRVKYINISELPRSKLRGIQIFKKLSSPLMGEDSGGGDDRIISPSP